MSKSVYGRSEVLAVGSVGFPEWQREFAYMVPFGPDGLPEHLLRWSPLVESMLCGLKFSRAFLTVDAAVILRNRSHRRPGIHIDGAWEPGLSMHGGRHRPGPSHGANSEQLLILASDVEGCSAFNGEFQLDDFNGGDCSSVPIKSLERIRMLPGVAYAGDACSFIHEPLPMQADCRRSLVRLNVELS